MKINIRKHLALLLLFIMIITSNLGVFAELLTEQDSSESNEEFSEVKISSVETQKVEDIEKYYTISYIVGENGIIDGDTEQIVIEGGDTIEVTAIGDDGYQFLSWNDGNLEATRYEKDVTADYTYKANFVEIEKIQDKNNIDLDDVETSVAQEKYKEVIVNAVWIPVDKDSGEVYDDLTPLITHPEAFEWYEVAELQDDDSKDYYNDYIISYMGTRIKDGGSSYYLNNFIYTANLFFSDQFHKVVAQGYRFNDLVALGQTSAVRKLVYGDFVVENPNGILGMDMTPYQEGETLKLYIDTRREAFLSSLDIVNQNLIVQRPKEINSLIDKLKENIVKYTYLNLETYAEHGEITIKNKDDMIWDQAFLYKYSTDNRSQGGFLRNSDEDRDYINIVNDLPIDDLDLGEYEVVIPIYWQKMIPDYVSASETLSRNRYKFDDTIHFTFIIEERDGADVTVIYVDEEGNQLADPEILSGKLGESWVTIPKEIEEWILKVNPENSSGIFTDDIQGVVYVYQKEPVEPMLIISKSASRSTYSRVGQEITYTITVKNTGNAVLSGIKVSDPVLSLDETIADLEPEKTWTYTGLYKVTRDDIDEGRIVNIAKVVTNEIGQRQASSTIRYSSPSPDPTPDPDPDPSPRQESEEIEIIDEEIPKALPELNKKDHFRYIQGYPDNTVRPEALITREEVATVFYRLLADEYIANVWILKNEFQDVDENRWSNKHISTLANGGILEGYPDGNFKPGEFITRAELATIASRFDNLSPFESNSFSDISQHWANRYINSASVKGWVDGYPDGSFKPNQYITRAEFVTLVNNVLDRRVHAGDILPEARNFADLTKDKWYYEAMQEAINSHHYLRRLDTYEEWTKIYYPTLDM